MWKIAVLAIAAACGFFYAGAASTMLDKGTSLVQAATP